MGTAPPTRPSTLDTALLRQLRLAKDAMDREWAEPLDVAAVAARAGYSRYHFVRLFRGVYGETPGRYLARRRIERAQDLLRSANLTVTEICMLVGFSSLGTFCTRFKELTGTTPTEFRARARRTGAPPIPGCFLMFWAGGFAPGRQTGERPGSGRGQQFSRRPPDAPPPSVTSGNHSRDAPEDVRHEGART
ncbi:helix-turn-helix transcriptional regulator [Actinomadura rubrisoli]|uniref:AraC family transcriptional regulator n=1 Tax=Actinomadura rubrisoli TaxID=2530368 RepID=A0A4R5AC62_9ACTN|nr:AraC family transcriptional regulator [Actinomadura rubrisoli]TDD69983.1 AraC family transcriptional regulator [Actinomadura rubrisoli]